MKQLFSLQRNNSILLFILLLLVSFSCKEDDDTSSNTDFFGNALVEVNSQSAQYSVSLTDRSNEIDEKFNISFNREIDDFHSDSFSIINLSYTFNVQEVSILINDESIDQTVSALYQTIVGGDAINHTYSINEEATNYFKINDYNPTTQEISGEFQLFFNLKSEGNTPPAAIESVNFINGAFTTRVDPSFFD